MFAGSRLLLPVSIDCVTETKEQQKPPQGGKNRQKTGAQSNIKHSHDVRQRISTGLQTQGDCIGRQRRVRRETQLEPLKQWLNNKMGGDRQSHGSTWHQQTTSHVLNTHRHLVASLGTPAGPWQLPAKKWVLYPQYWYLLRKSHLVWIRRKICKGHAPFTSKNSPKHF